jgi:acyl-CoA synthetase (NDP forming)
MRPVSVLRPAGGAPTEHEVKQILAAYGIPTPRGVVVTTEQEVPHLDLAYPVALKVSSARIVHKTEVGGVLLDIADEHALIKAFRDMRTRFPVEPFLIETMEQPGLEAIVGLLHDPTFGLCIACGLGGTFAEILEDVTFRVLPIDRRDALSMIADLKSARVFRGFRGRAVDTAALVDLMVRLSTLGIDLESEIDQLDLNPVIMKADGVCVVDAKLVVKERMTPAPDRALHSPRALHPMLYPQSVAVVGATNNPAKYGHLLMKNLVEGGFRGRIFPINPHATEILGLPCRKSVLEIEQGVDLAIVVVPVEAVLQAIEECEQKDVRTIVLITAGFDELGAEGRTRREELDRVLHGGRARVLGPNVMGIINTACALNGAFAIETLIPRFTCGGIGIIAQGGGVGLAFLQHATIDRLGFALYVPLGNKADTDEADWIRFMEEDPLVNVIAVHLEGIKSGRRLLEALRPARKPVVVLKTGRTASGQRAAMSHSAALAANDRILGGVLRQHGVLQAETSEEFYDIAKTLDRLGRVSARRLLVIGSSGSLGVLAADLADRYGLELPDLPEDIKQSLKAFLPAHAIIRNPMDTASISAEVFEKIAESDIMAPYDMLLLILGDPIERASSAVKMFKERGGKPVFVVFCGGGTIEEVERPKIAELGLPVFPSVERALGYFRALSQAGVENIVDLQSTRRADAGGLATNWEAHNRPV